MATPAKSRVVDAPAPEGGVEVGAGEAADSLMGEHDVTVTRGEGFDDLGEFAAVLEASGLCDDSQERRIHIEVGEVRLPCDPGVDHGGAGFAGGGDERGDLVDDAAFAHLLAEEVGEGAGGGRRRHFAVDRDNGGVGGVEFHRQSPEWVGREVQAAG